MHPNRQVAVFTTEQASLFWHSNSWLQYREVAVYPDINNCRQLRHLLVKNRNSMLVLALWPKRFSPPSEQWLHLVEKPRSVRGEWLERGLGRRRVREEGGKEKM